MLSVTRGVTEYHLGRARDRVSSSAFSSSSSRGFFSTCDVFSTWRPPSASHSTTAQLSRRPSPPPPTTSGRGSATRASPVPRCPPSSYDHRQQIPQQTLNPDLDCVTAAATTHTKPPSHEVAGPTAAHTKPLLASTTTPLCHRLLSSTISL
jgi:hypothetical protein